MRVIFLTLGDNTTASSRYRVFELVPYLEQNGIKCTVISLEHYREKLPGPDILSDLITILILTLKLLFSDILYVQKVPLPPLYFKFIGKIIDYTVYDLDDAQYAAPIWNEEEDTVEYLPQILNSVTATVAGSPKLEDYAREYSNQVFCLPTGIPKEEYEHLASQAQNDSKTTVGWIGNPQNLHYLQSIEEPLCTVLDMYEDVELSIITSDRRPITPLEHRQGIDVYYREWSLDKEIELLSEFDIAIRPLINDEYTQAKGGFTSVVQCMACRIPVVVSPITMLNNIVKHGESGFHAKNDEDWVKYLNLLIASPEKREEMGHKAYQSIDNDEFWSEDKADELANIFEILTHK